MPAVALAATAVFKYEGWHLDARIVITDITFRLPKHWQPQNAGADIANELTAREISAPNAQQIADAVIAVRQRKLPDPARIPNTCGSLFHNPIADATTA